MEELSSVILTFYTIYAKIDLSNVDRNPASPNDARTERNLMPEIEFSIGSRANEAARQLAELANSWNETYTGKFNGVTMVADPGCKPQDILQAFWTEQERRSEEYRNSPEGIRAAQEAKDRKDACQAAIDELMQRFETLNYEDLDELVQFFDDLTEPSDHIGVSFNRPRIVDTFALHGFVST